MKSDERLFGVFPKFFTVENTQSMNLNTNSDLGFQEVICTSLISLLAFV